MRLDIWTDPDAPQGERKPAETKQSTVTLCAAEKGSTRVCLAPSTPPRQREADHEEVVFQVVQGDPNVSGLPVIGLKRVYFDFLSEVL